jgi:hypothetical protein
MKTTLELPDDLFVEAKTVAAKRRITLKELFTKALEKEIRPLRDPSSADHFEIDEHGWPVLKRKLGDGIVVTNEFVNQLREREGI